MEKSEEDAKTGCSEGASKIPFVNVLRKLENTAWGIFRTAEASHASSDASLFSSSLPVLPHEKFNFPDLEHLHQSVDDSLPNLIKVDQEFETKDPLEDAESNSFRITLPDDEDELLAGLTDDFDLTRLPSHLEEMEEYDLFGSGGGMELDFESQDHLGINLSKLSLSDGVSPNGISQYAVSNGAATVAGEHPYGEHPSRTLFVRNINSYVEDSELRSLFEQYGHIRTVYTACKHRGFVMISYYDIRSARDAMRALQNKPLRRRKLDIHFSIPKDNPSEKDINQGTLVVFNLDASVSNDELRQIFGAYGEVKEIRETPHKRHHKFIEFYDVRHAEEALRALNRSDIAGKRIKLEPSRPGGARRNLMQQLSQELDQDETRSFRHQVGSPITNSPPGTWAQIGIPIDQFGFSRSPGVGSPSPVYGSHSPGLASILPTHFPNSPKIAPIGKDLGKLNHASPIFSNSTSTTGETYQHAHSFPDQKLSTSPGPISYGESKSNSSGIGTLSGPQFLWGSPTQYSEPKPSAWPTSSAGNPFFPGGQRQGFPYTSRPSSFLSSHNHHVGSAPSGVPLDRHFGYFPESPETSFMNPPFGGVGLSHNNGNHMMNMGGRANANPVVGFPGNSSDNVSPSFRMISMQKPSPLYVGKGSYTGPATTTSELFADRGRSRRVENSGTHVESKKQYELDLDKILQGEDSRTTLMIKNIPNKYTSKMLLAAIDENHGSTYDFLYLPIDFKNKCNVGYAFINMVSPSHIVAFYQAFNGKKWEKFNSEKVASLAYARIQGKAALKTHFQNSSLMNEDKRCRPILFHSDGQENGDEETFLSRNMNICIRQPDGSYVGDSLDSPRVYRDGNPDNE